MISILEDPNFCFDKLDFRAEKKEDWPVDIFRDSTSNTLSFGCVRRHWVLRAKFFAIRGVYHEKLASGWAWHILVISCAPGMDVIASARASSVVRVYLRNICCTHAVWHQKDQTKCQLGHHRSMGACGSFGLLASVFQGFCVQDEVYIVNSRNIELIDI